MTRIPAHLIEPPGEILREEIESRGWTQSDLAEIMGRPLAAVNEIINGKRKITARTAAQLGAALDIDPQFWLNLESSYQLSRTGKQQDTNDFAKLMNYAPVKEMQSRGWLPRTRSTSTLKESVLSFFAVDSLAEKPALAGAFRQSAGDISTSHVAWCIRSLQKAQAQDVKKYDPSRVGELKQELRAMAAYADEVRKVPSVLANYGIRFVIVKHLKSTKTDGAALWLDKASKAKPVIVMSLRYGRIDYFWHTLCHELSHIAHRDSFKLDLDLASAKEGEAVDEVEERANEEAASMLIPRDELRSFIVRKRPYFSTKSIIQFANRVRIHPGIIVGQLQYRKAIKYTHSQKMLVQIRDNVIETSVTDGWT